MMQTNALTVIGGESILGFFKGEENCLLVAGERSVRAFPGGGDLLADAAKIEGGPGDAGAEAEGVSTGTAGDVGWRGGFKIDATAEADAREQISDGDANAGGFCGERVFRHTNVRTTAQQVGGFDCKPVAGELTYGLERLAMYIQGVDWVYDLRFNDAGVSYGDVFLENERQLSKYNFEIADTDQLFKGFQHAEAECRRCIEAEIPLAAYDQTIEASHLFNLLQARGVISVQERASYIGRVRDLAKGSCEAWIRKNEARWSEQLPGWTV